VPVSADDVTSTDVVSTDQSVSPMVTGKDLAFWDKWSVPNSEAQVNTGIKFNGPVYSPPINPTDENYYYSIAWQNLGINIIFLPYTIQIILSGDNAFPAYTIQIDGVVLAGGGQTELDNIKIDIPSTDHVHYGAHYTCISGTLDDQGQVPEDNERNNAEWTNIYYIYVVPGQQYSGHIYITNAMTVPVTVSNFVLPGQVPPGWIVSVSPSSMKIPPHGMKSLNVYITPPNPMTYNYTIITHSYTSQYNWDEPGYFFTDPNVQI
jgi:hypothetical protein